MKCNQAKKLLSEACVHVRNNSEVCWLRKVRVFGNVKGEYCTEIHSTYLGVAEDSAQAIFKQLRVLNISKHI